MKRKVVSLDYIRAHSTVFDMTRDYSLGVCALVDVENAGFIGRSTKNRWYHFTLGGVPCVYFKYVD